jgi:uncharacterized RDD family membrane protein YckC
LAPGLCQLGIFDIAECFMGEEVKADSAKRIVATAVDLIIAGLVYMLLSLLLGRFIAAALAGLFLLGRDALFGNGVSPGKKLLGLRVISGSGGVIDSLTSAKRNLSVAAPYLALVGLILLAVLPFFSVHMALILAAVVGLISLGMELYKIIGDPTGLRLGDLLADTRVIELAVDIQPAVKG